MFFVVVVFVGVGGLKVFLSFFFFWGGVEGGQRENPPIMRVPLC